MATAIRGSAAAFAAYCNIGKKSTEQSLRLISINSNCFDSSSIYLSHPFLRGYPFLPTPNCYKGFTYPIRAVHNTTFAADKQYEEKPSQNWRIKMLYDGDCPLCMREVNMLKERNKRYGLINFVDISSVNYSPEENQGLDYKIAMGKIHAILADGTIVTNVEAFRKLYEVVGLGWVYAITKYKPVAKIADVIYGIWAKYRLKMAGRPPLEQIVKERKMKDECKVCKM